MGPPSGMRGGDMGVANGMRGNMDGGPGLLGSGMGNITSGMGRSGMGAMGPASGMSGQNPFMKREPNTPAMHSMGGRDPSSSMGMQGMGGGQGGRENDPMG